MQELRHQQMRLTDYKFGVRLAISSAKKPKRKIRTDGVGGYSSSSISSNNRISDVSMLS